jgi:hypothetical protein
VSTTTNACARRGSKDSDLGGTGGENVVEQRAVDVVAVRRQVRERKQVVFHVEHRGGVTELEIDVHQGRPSSGTVGKGQGEVGGDHRRAGPALSGERHHHRCPAARRSNTAPPRLHAGVRTVRLRRIAPTTRWEDPGGDLDGLEELRTIG